MAGAGQFCTFFLQDRFLGVEAERVQEVLRHLEMTRVPAAHPVIRGLVNLRGQIVTGIDLRRRLNMPDKTTGGPPMHVVVRTEDGAVSLLVDEIGDVIEVSSDNFEPPPETMQGMARELIQGVYKLKEHLLLILDIDRAVNLITETKE